MRKFGNVLRPSNAVWSARAGRNGSLMAFLHFIKLNLDEETKHFVGEIFVPRDCLKRWISGTHFLNTKKMKDTYIVELLFIYFYL